MRRLLLILVCALVFAPAAFADGSRPTVELLSTSKSVSAADLTNGLPAFQQAVEDLASVWGTDATLIVGDPAQPAPADMTLVVTDQLDCLFCLGYHGVTARRQPFAKIFPSGPEDWTIVLMHELDEMLVDPTCARFEMGNGRMWLVEPADPVESGAFSYLIDGVAVSDFITPAWYRAFAPGPYDFAGTLTRPFQVGRHGYASFRTDSGWHQVFG